MSFSVVTYNVLASAYAFPQRYPDSPREALDARRRIPALVERIVGLDADVLCLQESESELHVTLERKLGPLGYAGKFARKRQGKPDGCSTFVRDARLRLIRSETLAYEDGRAGKPPSGHIALIASIESDGRRVLVANTHLKWEEPQTPAAERWSFRQATLLLKHLRDAGDADWIVCGDFNVRPGDETLALLERTGLEETHSATGPTAVIDRQAVRLDYLFHTRGLAAKPWPLPDLAGERGLPSAQHPSDHVPVGATFETKGSPA